MSDEIIAIVPEVLTPHPSRLVKFYYPEDIADLAEDIRQNGQLMPVTVDVDYVVHKGWRRVLAIRLLGIMYPEDSRWFRINAINV